MNPIVVPKSLRGAYPLVKQALDVLVSFENMVDIFTFLEFKEYLESILKKKVDLVTPDSIHRELKEEILGQFMPRRKWELRITDIQSNLPPLIPRLKKVLQTLK